MYSQLQSVGSSGDGDEQDERSSGEAGAEAAALIGPPGLAVASAPDGQDVAPPDALLLEETASAVVPRPTPVSSLLSEIARAMQVAADQERERIDASVGEEQDAQVEKIHTRAAAESDELKRQADKDVSLVNAWRKDQIRRIAQDADRQVDDRRLRLDESLTHHGSLIQAEVESVQVAVALYRASLRAFFGRLSQEQDPSEIARLAGTLPESPDLLEVRANARSDAMNELEQSSKAAARDEPAEPVGVMDPGIERRAGALSQENVALRLIHSLTSRTSPTGASEDR
jgi:hypothetical protein